MNEKFLRYANILVGKFSDFRLAPKVHGVSARKQVDIRDNKAFRTMADAVMNEKRSLLYYDRLFHIYQALGQASKTANRNKSPFVAAEIGSFKGGTSKFMCERLRELNSDNVRMFSIDTFTGHSDKDLTTRDSHGTGTFIETSFESVSEYLSPYQFATVVQGRIQDCFDTIVAENGPFSFIHLDVDIESPVTFVLEKLRDEGSMHNGGVLVIDDYGFKTCLGLRHAVDEFLAASPNFFGVELASGQALLVCLRRA